MQLVSVKIEIYVIYLQGEKLRGLEEKERRSSSFGCPAEQRPDQSRPGWLPFKHSPTLAPWPGLLLVSGLYVRCARSMVCA